MNTVFQSEPACEDIVRALLDETNTDSPPTSPEILADYLGLAIDFFHDHSRYNLSDRVKAFLWPKKRLIGVYKDLNRAQKRFSILHEIGHFVLPGHATHPKLLNKEGKIADEGENLSGSAAKKGVIAQEIEANQFAADCLFQLERFDRRVNVTELDWLNIRVAADSYGASIEATARRWVEKSNQLCALVALTPQTRDQSESVLGIMYTIVSASFGDTYFSSLERGQKLGADSVAHRLFHDRYSEPDFPPEIIRVNLGGEYVQEFDVDWFSNSYRVFGLLTPKEF